MWHMKRWRKNRRKLPWTATKTDSTKEERNRGTDRDDVRADWMEGSAQELGNGGRENLEIDRIERKRRLRRRKEIC